ncbi:MAG: PASTA domain-containing protein, partial [Actinobacteria bacterium]|nr:PASTA domain-containing protein [Actinomycetota bacterium]
LDAQGLVTALMAVADGFDDPEPLELEGERAGAVIDAPLEPFDDITLVVPSAPVHDPSTEEAEPAPLGPISEEGSDLVGPTTPVDAGSDVGERAEATEPSGGPTPSATTRGRRRWRIAWVSLVVVLLVGGAAVGLLVWRAHRVPTHVVPSVAGLDASTARTRLEHLGFIVDTRHIRRDGTHAGELVGVSPPAGTRLAEGKTVTLEVSDGQTLVTVPNALIGLGEDTARSRLDGLGLAIGSVSKRYSETVPAGRVLSTEPAAGAEVEKGGPVGLVVSDGPEPRVVPSVSGMSPERAEAALRSIGLVPVVVERFDTKVDTGGLIGVEPAPGASVPRGASVQVVVSKGLLVAVPSLSGITTVSGAISALQSVGLVANSLEGSGSLSGRPVAFNPPAGQLVAKGSRVDIVVQ